MLEKFVSIQNVGRFCDCKFKGNISLNKLTLLHGENGRGKTTLCAILRSLQTNQPRFILERKTLGNINQPNIHIRLDEQNFLFANGSWSNGYPNIALFDAIFINENVYAGDYIEADHRKNLYRVIVGDIGVGIARNIDLLDEKIRNINTVLKDKRETIQSLIPVNITFDDYISWIFVENIDSIIQTKTEELSAKQLLLSKSQEIQQKNILLKVSLPVFPENFLQTLGRQLTDISSNAESSVRAQIATHRMGTQGETWLAQGINYIHDSKCPFCGQGIDGNTLISAYHSHFNIAYRNFSREVSQLKQNILAVIGDSALNQANNITLNNLALAEFWRQFAAIDIPHLNFDDIRSKYAVLCAIAVELAQKKEQTPLEAIQIDSRFQKALTDILAFQSIINIYNTSIDEHNIKINQYKKSIQQPDTTALLREEINLLHARKARFHDETIQKCQEYVTILTEKNNLDREKAERKQELDAYSANIIQAYQDSINAYLDQFNVGFRIVNTRYDYRGGTPRSLFQLQINDIPIDVGDSQTQPGTPSFKTTLSSGDRSALALAFFLSTLKNDSSIGNKIIVFDDPFTSLDRFRRECTAQLIVSFAQNAAQTIVLSHDPGFLKLVSDKSVSIQPKELQIVKTAIGSVIAEWSAKEATQTDFEKNHSILLKYYREYSGDMLSVARAIRPFLEALCRIHFIGHFDAQNMLGEIIQKIRDSQDDSGLSHAKSDLIELSAINDYSQKYHHPSPPAIDSGELHGFVKRTLAFVGGLK